MGDGNQSEEKIGVPLKSTNGNWRGNSTGNAVKKPKNDKTELMR